MQEADAINIHLLLVLMLFRALNKFIFGSKLFDKQFC